MIAFQDPLGQMPPPASTFAPDVDGLFNLLIWISFFFFFLITGLLFYSAVKWRRKTPDQPPAALTTHNTMLEVVWTAIPTVILMVVFAWGWKGNLDQSVAPGNALQYRVTASQWNWAFAHPDGRVAANQLWVPVNTPVKLVMSSLDVLHSFYVPAFRCKRDVLPGRYQMVWFEATELGDYNLFCTEYCGREHSIMTGMVHVVSQEEYDTKPWNVRPEDPVEWGEMLVQSFCISCHSVDDTVKATAPQLKGVWGREERIAGMADPITVDEAYIRESILEPKAKIVEGFEDAGAMTQYPPSIIGTEELDAIVEYLKQLK